MLYDTRSSNPVLCDNLEVQDWMGGGKELQETENICVPMVDSC